MSNYRKVRVVVVEEIKRIVGEKYILVDDEVKLKEYSHVKIAETKYHGDVTRLWVRHHILLPPILDELNHSGVEDSDILIIATTGNHREQTAEEHGKLVGEDACRQIKIIDHWARADAEVVCIGTTYYGNEVLINRKAIEADRVILTGGIVYHFLAGWGGGKKAIIPGVAGYRAIMNNQTLALHPEPGRGINPEVRAGNLKGNPCSKDMIQGGEELLEAYLMPHGGSTLPLPE